MNYGDSFYNLVGGILWVAVFLQVAFWQYTYRSQQLKLNYPGHRHHSRTGLNHHSLQQPFSQEKKIIPEIIRARA